MAILLFAPAAHARIRFIENKGQWDANILYRADIPGGAFFLEKDKITYSFYDEAALHQAWHQNKKNQIIKSHVVKIGFNASPGASFIAQDEKLEEYYNYFIGDDPKKWASHVGAYTRLVMKDVWKGIDLEIVSTNDHIKYTFIVSPKADPSQIKMIYEGAENLVVENSLLQISTSLGKIIEQSPVANQNHTASRSSINVAYKINDNAVSFNVGNYNRHDTLYIDPLVIFATFSGSYADNFGFTATYDSLGDGYSGGTVFAKGFPTKSGAFQANYAGGFDDHQNLEYARDAGILKYSPDGTKLLWATYLGGSNNEQPHSMVVNNKNELLVYGSTSSSNFPMASTGYSRKYKGGSDIYVVRLSSDGTTLLSSTFMGGSGRDGINGDTPDSYPSGPLAYNYGDMCRGEIIVDDKDNVYVASCTQSSDFPILNAFQPKFGGGAQDACVFKLNPDLTQLVWSSFLGGWLQDMANGIHLDSKGNVFVCGGTQSNNLPMAGNPPTKTFQGDRDGFLYKISADGKTLLASTYAGTSLYDQAFFVQVDNFDRVYITGQSAGNFPVTPNVYFNNNGHQFIAVYSNDLSQVLQSTVFGSGRPTVDLSPSAFLVDRCGRVYFSGWGGVDNNLYSSITGSTAGLPITPDAYQSATDGSDFYLIILSRDMKSLVYGSYFGGSVSYEHVDGGTSRFDRDGRVYQSVCGGCGGYSDFPTTPGAYSRTNNGKRPGNSKEGGCNNALFKLDLNSSNYPPKTFDTVLTVTGTEELKYSFTATDPDKGDSVYITASSSIFDSNAVGPPSAVLKFDSGVNVAHGTLIWNTACHHVKKDTYTVTIHLRDNGCPTPRSSNARIRIVVKEPPLPSPPAIFCLKHGSSNEITLNWDQFKIDKYTKSYSLVKVFPDGHWVKLKEIKDSTDRRYYDNNAPNNLTNNFYYFMYGTNICGHNGDSTRKIGTVPDKDSIPSKVNVFTTTVEKNKDIRVIWKRYPKLDFYYYMVYRQEAGTGEFLLFNVYKNIKDTTMLDTTVDVQAKSYCYMVLVQNQCGLSSPDGDVGCSILLKGQSIPFEHHLYWNAYKVWQDGVDNYQIIRRDPATPDATLAVNPNNSLNYNDNNLNYDQGIYWYRIEASEKPGLNNAKSVSNEIKLVQAPLLHVPNAFTPNNDSINDIWETVPVFVKDYHLKIYNRWGQFVWETNNKKEKWKGVYHSDDPFNNVFVWQVEYTGWDNSSFYRTGYITVLP